MDYFNSVDYLVAKYIDNGIVCGLGSLPYVNEHGCHLWWRTLMYGIEGNVECVQHPLG